MAETIKLNFEPRKVGNKYAREAREQGLIPVVLYGLGESNEYYTIKNSEFSKKVIGHETELFNIDLGEKRKMNTVIKDQVYDSLSNSYVHLDFMRVDANSSIEVQVPLKFKGEAVGVKTGGGILNKILDEIEVECIPGNIPSEIIVDVTALELDHKISVKDLDIPSNVTLITDKELTVAVVHMKQEDAVEEKAEEVAPVVEASTEKAKK